MLRRSLPRLANTSNLRTFQYSRERKSSRKNIQVNDAETNAIFASIHRQMSINRVDAANTLKPVDEAVLLAMQTKISFAIEEKNLLNLWNQWQTASKEDCLALLGESLYTKISSFIATTCFRRTPGDAWDPEEKKAIHQMAMFLAAREAYDALATCMLAHVRDKNSTEVIELYARFMHGKDEKQAPVQPQLDDDLLLAPISNATTTYQHSPGRAAILLAVIAAHAIKKSFVGAVRVCLDTHIRFRTASTKAFVHKVREKELQFRILNYIDRLEAVRIFLSPNILQTQVMKYTNESDASAILELYQSMIECITGPDAFIAPHNAPRQKFITLPDVVWPTFLKGFLACHRRDLGAALWDDMNKLQIKPGVANWTTLIEGYGNDGATDLVLSTWDTMIAQNIRPDPLAYRAIIYALYKSDEPRLAVQYFNEFKTTKAPLSNQVSSVYNTTILGLLNAKDESTALELLEQMETDGPKPDVVTFNTFISYYGRASDFKALASMMTKMTSAGLYGDVFTFSSILSALLRAGQENATETVLNLMRKQGVAPNVATYGSIIDHLMNQRDERSYRAVLTLLQKMENDPVVKPNVITYTSIIAGLYRGNWITSEMAEVQRKDILLRMRNQGIAMNRVTYRILMRACLQSHHPQGLRDCLDYYRQMLERNIPLEQDDWYIIFAGLIYRQEWHHADAMVRNMLKTGKSVKPRVSRLMDKIHRRVLPDVIKQ